MSDDDYMSEESYEFEFEDDDVSDHSVREDLNHEQQLQNDYYEAKAFKDEDPHKSISRLQSLVDNNQQKQDTITWIYKSIKQMAKIHYMEHEFQQCLDTLGQLKSILPQITDYHYLDESMNKIFNNYSNNKDKQFMLQLSDIVLEFLDIIRQNRSNNNYNSTDRLWIKINLSRFSILLSQNRYEKCEQILSALQHKLASVSDVTKNSYSLEIIASEIEFLTITNRFDLARLNPLYQKSLNIVSPVTHPRIMGVIKQCGGKLEFYNKNYHESRSKFYESFRNFDESGSILDKKESFKFLILLSMITENEFNPFESQETQHYIEEEEFVPLISVLESFNDLNLDQFSTICSRWGNDSFSQNDICLKSMDIIKSLIIDKKLLNIFKSFTNVSFEFIQDDLHVSEDTLVDILMKLGVEGKLFNVKVDFVNKIAITYEEPTLQLAPNLSAKQIIHNLHCVISIDLLELCASTKDSSHEELLIAEEDEMNIDRPPSSQSGAGPIGSRGNDKLGIDSKVERFTREQLHFVKITTQPGLTPVIEDWYTLLQQSFPYKHQQELSTKDQIYSEQKLIKSANDNNDYNANSESISGASGPGSSANVAGLINATQRLLDPEHEESTTDVNGEKLRSLKLLSSELLAILTET